MYIYRSIPLGDKHEWRGAFGGREVMGKVKAVLGMNENKQKTFHLRM